jgi:tetratricopeptide (TPR) repeat protein
MNTLRDMIGILGFQERALRAMASRMTFVPAIFGFAAGFMAFVMVRNSVYASLRAESHGLFSPSYLGSLLRLNLIQSILFFSIIYIPSVVCLSNAIAGEGLGLSLSRAEYRSHVAVLFPLWGSLLLIAAPVQLILPQFLVVGDFGISVGLLLFVLLAVIYTVWGIRELNHISTVAAVGAFTLSWVTLPVFYVLSTFFFTLPLFIMIPVIYLGFQRFRMHISEREGERALQQRLQKLILNPQDADAQHQLGLIHMRRRTFETARAYLEQAVKIDPSDPEFHYSLGQVFESQEKWNMALEEYEETYRLNPEQNLGDIFREVGKAYLHTGNVEKAIEFLEFFLQTRGSDPEGRYWLAVALQKVGKPEEMRVQLNTILEQSRSNPRFFRKEKRAWVLRARTLMKSCASDQ